MKKQPKFTKITEAEYNVAKWLLMTQKPAQAARTLGRSHVTLSHIAKSTDLEHYRQIVAELSKKQKAREIGRTPKEDIATEESTVSVPTEDLAKMFTLLAEISEKLDRVAVPKRSIFR